MSPPELAALLVRESQQDVEGQRELIAARAKGETNAVYWRERDEVSRWRERTRHCIEETRRAIVRARSSARCIERYVVHSKALLGLD